MLPGLKPVYRKQNTDKSPVGTFYTGAFISGGLLEKEEQEKKGRIMCFHF